MNIRSVAASLGLALALCLPTLASAQFDADKANPANGGIKSDVGPPLKKQAKSTGSRSHMSSKSMRSHRSSGHMAAGKMSSMKGRASGKSSGMKKRTAQ